MHCHRSSRRTIVLEEFGINVVIAGEIIHIHQISRNLDHILEPRAGALQDVTNILDHRACLQANVEPRSAEARRALVPETNRKSPARFT